MSRLAWIPVLLVALQCSDDPTSGPVGPSGPSIVITDTAPTFTAVAGASTPTPLTLAVTNGGTGSLTQLNYTVAYTPGQRSNWLAVSMNVRTAPTSLWMVPVTNLLGPGTYTATVTVSSPDAVDGVRRVTVTTTVTTAPTPVIILTDDGHTFTAVDGGPAAAAMTLEVLNGGTGPLSGLTVAVEYDQWSPSGWLNATLSTTTAPATLTVAPTPGAHPLGLYIANVMVRSPAASNGAQRYRVLFYMQQASGSALGYYPTVVELSGAAGGSIQPSTVQVLSLGLGQVADVVQSVSYPSGYAGGWLDATLANNRAPTTISLVPHTGSLGAGEFKAIVTVSSPTAAPKVLNVTARMVGSTTGPAIGLSGNRVPFSAPRGATNPIETVLQVTNAGVGSLVGLDGRVTYTAGQSTGWLFAQFATNTAPTTLTIRATAGTRPAGTYTAAITLNATGASPRTIDVTLTITP